MVVTAARATPRPRGSTSNRATPSGVRAAASSTSARSPSSTWCASPVSTQSSGDETTGAVRPRARRWDRRAGAGELGAGELGASGPGGGGLGDGLDGLRGAGPGGGAGGARGLAGIPVAGRRRPGQGRDRGAIGDRGQQALARLCVAGRQQRLGGEDRRAEQRRAGQAAPQFLHHDVGLDRPGAGAAVALRYREPGDADLAAQPPPERPVVSGVPTPLRQQPTDRVAQVPLLVGQFHARPPSAIAAMTRARCPAWLPQAPASARTLVSHRCRSCSWV